MVSFSQVFRGGSRGLDGVSAITPYQLLSIVATAPMLVLIAVNNVWSVHIYRLRSDERVTRQVSIDRVALVGPLSMALIAGLLAPQLVNFATDGPVTGVTYSTALILAITVVPYGLYLSATHSIVVTNRTRVLFLAAPATVALALPMGLFLVDVRGMLGAAATAAASQAILSVVVYALPAG